VIAGKKTEARILEEFLAQFESFINNNIGEISKNEWLAY